MKQRRIPAIAMMAAAGALAFGAVGCEVEDGADGTGDPLLEENDDLGGDLDG
ncbi:MAG: hypothetical protein R6V28_09295 [Nitriliruptoraceae bacterium]